MPKVAIKGEGQANYGDYYIYATFIALYKSYLLLITDQQEFGIGNVTLSGPPTELGQASTSPFNMFGLKNPLLSNMIGKTASKQLKSPVISMIFIKEKELKTEIVMKLAMEAVSEAIKKTKKELKMS
ncbi:MAG: hypothetical protein ACTSWX_00455 [Promethearchaeota archaeon]